MKSAFQIHIDDTVKIFFLHGHQQSVLRDACIIDQKINPAVFFCHCLEKGFTGCKITDIALKNIRPAAFIYDLLLYSRSLAF